MPLLATQKPSQLFLGSTQNFKPRYGTDNITPVARLLITAKPSPEKPDEVQKIYVVETARSTALYAATAPRAMGDEALCDESLFLCPTVSPHCLRSGT